MFDGACRLVITEAEIGDQLGHCCTRRKARHRVSAHLHSVLRVRFQSTDQIISHIGITNNNGRLVKARLSNNTREKRRFPTSCEKRRRELPFDRLVVDLVANNETVGLIRWLPEEVDAIAAEGYAAQIRHWTWTALLCKEPHFGTGRAQIAFGFDTNARTDFAVGRRIENGRPRLIGRNVRDDSQRVLRIGNAEHFNLHAQHAYKRCKAVQATW